MSRSAPDGVIVLRAGEGRHYQCGPMQADFLADGTETGDRYSVSIWWVDPGQPGPGPHSHEANEELFYVIEGTMTFLVGDRYVDAATGTFLRIPAGVTHDFENRTTARAGALNVFIPGGFEENMPSIVAWYRDQEKGPEKRRMSPRSEGAPSVEANRELRSLSKRPMMLPLPPLWHRVRAALPPNCPLPSTAVHVLLDLDIDNSGTITRAAIVPRSAGRDAPAQPQHITVNGELRVAPHLDEAPGEVAQAVADGFTGLQCDPGERDGIPVAVRMFRIDVAVHPDRLRTETVS